MRATRQADRVQLRPRQTNTTRRAHPAPTTTNPIPDRPATTRPRQQRLRATRCAHAGLQTLNATQMISPTRPPRTAGSPTRRVEYGPTTAKYRNRQDDYTNNIQPCKRRLQRKGTNGEEAGCEAASTTVQKENRCRNNNPTLKRRHASRPKPNQPDMQGSKREQHPTGRPHHGPPRRPTPIPTTTAEHRNPPLRNRPASNKYTKYPGPLGEHKLDRVKRRE